MTMGLIAAGVRYGSAYPITPWSSIMETLRSELPKYGGIYVQAEDELAAVSMTIGAAFAGHLAVTGSSGPGLSLKMEALSYASMAEIPLIVINVQRGGPSTGLPTSVEQSDLMQAIYGSHGDCPRIVLAPKDVEDCFYIASKPAARPRVLLPRHHPQRSGAQQPHRGLHRAGSRQALGRAHARPLPRGADFKPYPLDQSHPPRTSGTKMLGGKYPHVTGLEHDEWGHPSGSPKMHQQMTDKRRNKLSSSARNCRCRRSTAMQEGDVLLIGWGSTYGPIKEAVNRLRPKATRSAPRTSATCTRCPQLDHLVGQVQESRRRRDERLRPLRLRPARHDAARRLRRSEDPVRLQDRRPRLPHPRDRHGVEKTSPPTDPPRFPNLSFSIVMSSATLDAPAAAPAADKLTKKILTADHPTWCPGCGDFAVLAAFYKVLEKLQYPHEKIVCVAGIGCSIALPVFHEHARHPLHPRPRLPLATGVSLSRPDVHVFVFGGDGDGFSIGGNHLNHAARKNIKLTYVIMDNYVYGLTKKQTSPTSPQGFKSKTDPTGSIDRPINPMKQLLASGATFIARTHAAQVKHMMDTFERAILHDGFSVVECLSECVMFYPGSL
jgi:2-oxoglutarate ferredoxin oxidoreductase subunit beta